MSLTLEELIKQAEQLSIPERLQLISRIAENLSHSDMPISVKKYSITDFRGIASNQLSGADAQNWVSELRHDWQEREQGFK